MNNPIGITPRGDIAFGSDVELVDIIAGTPALELALRGWVEINDQGLHDGTLNCYPHLKAILGYAMNGRDRLPVGVITFEHEAMQRRVWAFQVYVLPEFRGRGVFTAMWAKLVEHSTEILKARSIEMGTHVRNSAMRAAAKRTGSVEEAVFLKFNLE